MIILLLVAGCTPQASYMRKWQPAERIANRWSGGTVRTDRLSEDEAAVFEELGTPDVIRLYRQVPTRERVYAWIYEESNRVIWFVEGQRADYVEVDKNTLPLSRASRQTLRQKAFAGGILVGTIGSLATGFILLGEDVGLKN
ncbi:MAG: hypothetical protein ETSY2_08450 [Candidatus Entotheonella gemina]|uniref:Uncharacterized protein n=2 Tax=Candidatus Entotheonella TaxID=93171 RepID=W4MC42_9BACT|nr:MAG: hypothetical protein ETSY2_08450 [Candidatus Entotheonella gemina]